MTVIAGQEPFDSSVDGRPGSAFSEAVSAFICPGWLYRPSRPKRQTPSLMCAYPWCSSTNSSAPVYAQSIMMHTERDFQTRCLLPLTLPPHLHPYTCSIRVTTNAANIKRITINPAWCFSPVILTMLKTKVGG